VLPFRGTDQLIKSVVGVVVIGVDDLVTVVYGFLRGIGDVGVILTGVVGIREVLQCFCPSRACSSFRYEALGFVGDRLIVRRVHAVAILDKCFESSRVTLEAVDEGRPNRLASARCLIGPKVGVKFHKASKDVTIADSGRIAVRVGTGQCQQLIPCIECGNVTEDFGLQPGGQLSLQSRVVK
jgi:hypothetical protein